METETKKQGRGRVILLVVGLVMLGAAAGGAIGLYWEELTAGGLGGLVGAAKELIREKVAPDAVLVLLSAAGILTAASPSWGAAMAKVVTAVAALSKATEAITGTDANGKDMIAEFKKRAAEDAKERAAEKAEMEDLRQKYADLMDEHRAYITESEAREERMEQKLDAALLMLEESSVTSELVRAGRAARIAAIRGEAMKEDGHGEGA